MSFGLESHRIGLLGLNRNSILYQSKIKFLFFIFLTKKFLPIFCLKIFDLKKFFLTKKI